MLYLSACRSISLSKQAAALLLLIAAALSLATTMAAAAPAAPATAAVSHPVRKLLTEDSNYSPSRTKSHFTCYLGDKCIGPVTIWKGHTENDAAKACNTYLPECEEKGWCHARGPHDRDVDCHNQERIETYWSCFIGDKCVGPVNIWWGHKEGDAAWACNKWKPDCTKEHNCHAKGPIQDMYECANQKYVESHWTCYNRNKCVGSVSIWWGHNKDVAEWACQHWVSNCEDGHCYAKGPHPWARKC